MRPDNTEPFQCWFNIGRAVYLTFRTSSYRLRFPDWRTSSCPTTGRGSRCFRKGLSNGTMGTWLNQVYPLALSLQGHVVLHGSAVEIGCGAVRVLRRFWRHGKSTLAAGFAVTGTRFATDDGLLLLPEGDQWLVSPNASVPSPALA